jgi:hypothetical protein
LGQPGLIDPRYPRLEDFVGLVGNRDADHAGQPSGYRFAQATADMSSVLPATRIVGADRSCPQ